MRARVPTAYFGFLAAVHAALPCHILSALADAPEVDVDRGREGHFPPCGAMATQHRDEMPRAVPPLHLTATALRALRLPVLRPPSQRALGAFQPLPLHGPTTTPTAAQPRLPRRREARGSEPSIRHFLIDSSCFRCFAALINRNARYGTCIVEPEDDIHGGISQLEAV